MNTERAGFTIAEVLLAVVLLTVGVLALVGAAAGTSRMIAKGRHGTMATAALAGRIEELHRIAGATVPSCSGPEWRSDSTSEAGVSLRWDVLDDTGIARRVRLILRHRGVATADTTMTAVLCPAA